MKRVLAGAFVSGMLLTPLPVRAGDLTLRDVIELHRSGLGEDLLIAVIEADGGPFTLGFADIHDLKSDGLSERIITALVRTGARRPVPADGAPAVVVEQHVTTVVPGVVVLPPAIPPPHAHGGRSDGDHPSRTGDRRDGQRRRDVRQPDLPAATWITRREDGRNVAQEAPRRRGDVPAATWVTPNSRTGSQDSGERNRPAHGEGRAPRLAPERIRTNRQGHT